MKTFDELFAELSVKAETRPEGSGTIAELDAGWEVFQTASGEIVARPFED